MHLAFVAMVIPAGTMSGFRQQQSELVAIFLYIFLGIVLENKKVTVHT